MDTYFKAISLAIVGILLCLILSKSAKDYSAIVAIMACCAVCVVAFQFLKPILGLIEEIFALAETNQQWFSILLKTVGIAFIGETASTVCSDAGQAAIAKSLQLLTTVVILWISIPLIETLLNVIQSVLEML